VEGVFVFWSETAKDQELDFLDEEFFVFANHYRILHLAKKVDSLDLEDALTGLFNREQYHRKLDEEIARARRLKNAVSIVKMSIDHLMEHEQSQGMSYKDSLVRSVAHLIRKTSRINDAACRTGENEFTLVLPHCPRKGAAIRGERLRRMVEAHDFAAQGLRVTLSLGVSEYPTLSKSVSELDRSALDALKFIAERSGNKVCMFRAPDGFRPDYDVVPV
jgi:diguanylate cyclase (GGDEF)-like protein